MNEFELIARLTATLPTNKSVVAGPGHDCAVVDAGLSDHFLLLKTDAVVEGVHFTKAIQPERVGHKALARCLSDIAAMAGTPSYALITIGLPAEFDVSFIEGIYRGLGKLAARHDIAVVGGETTRNPERIFISVALAGVVHKNRFTLRSGAKPGDAIFVTGHLGGSSLGKHLDFEPRLVEARWLAEHFAIHAMMDLSDGLAGDLRHLLKASEVGAELLATAIPVSRAAKQKIRTPSGGNGKIEGAINVSKPALLAALTDGEDFELLFTIGSRDAVPVLDAWKKQFPDLELSCIGKITAAHGLTIRDQQGVRPLTVHGYTHFA
jgi:thiamine-monophosphate kinase